jgi:hypothetical protein
VLVRCVRSPKTVTLAVDEKSAPGFGEYLFANLEGLYASYRARKAGSD